MRLTGLLFLLSILMACGSGSDLSVEFAPASGTPTELPLNPSTTKTTEAPTRRPVPPKLGFIPARGEDPIVIENGGRVPVAEDMVAEVFVSPYPPNWNTDLHLFLLQKDNFEPVSDVSVDLDYEMLWMDHGIDTQIGRKINDGHYLLPLSFLMYGDWLVDIRMAFEDRDKKHLRFVVKFDP